MRNKEKKEKVNKRESDLVTKESLSAVCALFSLLALLILFTNSLVFGEVIGGTIHAFLTGVFGYMAYPVLLGALYLSVTSLIGKRFVKNRRAGTYIALTVIFIALLVHTAITYSWAKEGYLAKCFEAGEAFPAATAAGWLGGLLVYALSSITTDVGSIVIFSLLILFFGYLSYISIKKGNPQKQQTEQKAEAQNAPVEIPLSSVSKPEEQPMPAPAPVAQNAYAYSEVTTPQRPAFTLSDEMAQAENTPQEPKRESTAFSPFGFGRDTVETENDTVRNTYENSREFLFGSTPAENYKRNLIFDPNARVNQRPSVDPSANPSVSVGFTPSYSESYQASVNEGSDRPLKIVSDGNYTGEPYTQEIAPAETIEPLRPIEEPPVTPQPTLSYPTYEEPKEEEETYYTDRETVREEELMPTRDGEYSRHDYMDLFSPANPNVFGNDEAGRAMAEETFSRRTEEEPETERTFSREDELSVFDRNPEPLEERGRNAIDIFDEEETVEEDPYTLRDSYDEPQRGGFETEREVRRFVEPAPIEEKPEPVRPQPEPTPPPPPKPRVIRPYVRVPLDDFDCRDVEPTQNHEEVEETKANIIATLEEFKVTGAAIASVTFGPTVTRYNVTIPRNISPRKVVALDQPIALSLHSNGVNIYPNYEDGVVSIEVPNKDRQFVQLGCMLAGDTFVNAKSSSIMFTMGKDAGNRKVYGDISKMIHLLVAGSSGSGKSVFLGSLIISLIYKYSPEELRLILIDPKKTEFVLYNDLPHLMINEIITDANKAVQSLNWAIGEMNRRYGLFEKMSRAGTYVVNLDQYNSHVEKAERLPKIVIIIDELADLMLAAKKDIEDRIQNLTQKARAAGIHLVVATQRPSTDVITGVIKSNLPTRIAFAVATDVDSRVILDQTGAQKLLGKGDFLYTMQGINTPVRVQSAFISSEDSQRVVNFIKANNEAYYDEEATAFINNSRSGNEGGSMGRGDEIEPVYIDALRYVILSNSASISLIQRKCSIGYNKAGKIVEWMEDMGYISSFDGAKARKVLITKEEFESKYGSL